MIKKLLNSKKFIGFLLGMGLEFLAASGLLDMDPSVRDSLMMWIGTGTSGYVLGQGIADHGKEKAKVEAGKE